MITRPGSLTVGAGGRCDDGLRRAGSKASTRAGARRGETAEWRSVRFGSAPTHSVTATARRTKAGRHATQKIDERGIVHTLLASPAKWSLRGPSDVPGLLKIVFRRCQHWRVGAVSRNCDACFVHDHITVLNLPISLKGLFGDSSILSKGLGSISSLSGEA
jgi:hypothetical protein